MAYKPLTKIVAGTMPVSTARYYVDKYIDFFTYTGDGRKRRYDEESTIEILTAISEYYAQNKADYEIIEYLSTVRQPVVSADFSEVEEEVEQQNNNKTIVKQQQTDMQALAPFLNNISASLAIIAEQQQEIQSLKNEIQTIKQRLDESKTNENKPKGWFRLFK